MKILPILVLSGMISVMTMTSCGVSDTAAPEQSSKTEDSVSELTSDQSETESESPDSKAAYAQEQIDQMMDSKNYQQADKQEKTKMAKTVLKELESRQYIKNLYYDESGELFSFEYANGILGGIQMRDFSGEEDGLMMN